MAHVTETRGPHQRARPVPAAFAAGAEGSIAIARARRHRVVVRALRIALPAAAVGMLCSYAMFVQRSIKVGGGTLTVGPVALQSFLVPPMT